MRTRTSTTTLAIWIILFIIGFIVLASLCSDAACTPKITNATNNQTRCAMYPDYGDTVTYAAEATEPITAWTWCVDGIVQTTTASSHPITYTTFGYHNVSVYGTNEDGSTNTTTWVVWVNRELKATHAEKVDETAYNMLHAAIGDETTPPSFHGFMQAITYPYTNALGLIFYLFLFGLPLLMMYIRQDSLTIPATLMFIIGGVIIAMIPSQWQVIAGALMGLALFGMLYKLYKERG